MIKPTNDVLKAVARLEHDENFKMFVSWISESNDEYNEVWVDSENPEAIQEAAKDLREILRVIRTARPTLERAEELERESKLMRTSNG